MNVENKIEHIESDLHIAVALNHVAELEKVLSLGMRDIHEQNENGDEPAHIAARLGHIECMKLLIEFDAHMGRRNWAGLTPIGEARMNGQKDIVDMLLNNYAFDYPKSKPKDTPFSDQPAWDKAILQGIDNWKEVWDAERQCTVWVKESGQNGGDGVKISDHPPAIYFDQIISARNQYQGRYVPRTIHPKSLQSQRRILEEKRKKQLQEQTIQLLKQQQIRIEYDCAMKLQAQWRRKQAARIREQIRLEHDSARAIQVTWRWRYRDYCHRVRQRATRKIQRNYRMRYAHHYYLNYLQERLWWYRAANILSRICQRLWRGFKGRAKGRRAHEKYHLPNPDDIDNFDFWIKCQEDSRPPRRKFGIYKEYTLSGTPITWLERNEMKRNGVYFRDVKFYVNTITRRASWDQRREWRVSDRREYEQREQARQLGYPLSALHAAQSVQSLWRGNVSRRNMRLVLKAKKIMENAEDIYLKNPSNIKAVSNYALYVHVVLHEYDKARPLYQFMMEFMEGRGIDNPFVLYSCAIFSALRREEDWHIIKDLSYRAKIAETSTSESAGKRNEKNKKCHRKSVYEVADAGFYRLTALLDKSAESWHNYALCRMLVFHDLVGAREAFLCALEQDPHDQHIISNFNMLIQDADFMAMPAPWDVFDEVQLEESEKRQNNNDIHGDDPK